MNWGYRSRGNVALLCFHYPHLHCAHCDPACCVLSPACWCSPVVIVARPSSKPSWYLFHQSGSWAGGHWWLRHIFLISPSFLLQALCSYTAKFSLDGEPVQQEHNSSNFHSFWFCDPCVGTPAYCPLRCLKLQRCLGKSACSCWDGKWLRKGGGRAGRRVGVASVVTREGRGASLSAAISQ